MATSSTGNTTYYIHINVQVNVCLQTMFNTKTFSKLEKKPNAASLSRCLIPGMSEIQDRGNPGPVKSRPF